MDPIALIPDIAAALGRPLSELENEVAGSLCGIAESEIRNRLAEGEINLPDVHKAARWAIVNAAARAMRVKAHSQDSDEYLVEVVDAVAINDSEWQSIQLARLAAADRLARLERTWIPFGNGRLY